MNISRTENRFSAKPVKESGLKKNGCYGMVGRHYDFKIRITGLHDWGRGGLVEGVDRLGRKMLIRFDNLSESECISVGGSLLFRGLVLAHDMIFDAPFTFIVATSKPVNF